MPQLLAAAAAAASAADRACQSPHHSTEDEATQANCTQTSEWVLNKAAVKRQLLDTVEARKQAYCGHTVSKQGSCLEKEIMQGTTPGARRRGRPRTAWMDNIKTWTGLSVEESIRMTEDRDKLRKYVQNTTACTRQAL